MDSAQEKKKGMRIQRLLRQTERRVHRAVHTLKKENYLLECPEACNVSRKQQKYP